jgi:hypothetical protein
MPGHLPVRLMKPARMSGRSVWECPRDVRLRLPFAPEHEWAGLQLSIQHVVAGRLEELPGVRPSIPVHVAATRAMLAARVRELDERQGYRHRCLPYPAG